jgi:hypothetical protein
MAEIKMPKGVKLLPCPFCGCSKWEIDIYPYGWEKEQRFQADCGGCPVRIFGEPDFTDKIKALKNLAEQINRREKTC